jgi:hypothetical protein
MLKKAVHELRHRKLHGAQPIALFMLVMEEHLAVFNLDHPAIRDGHPKDVGCQIFDAGLGFSVIAAS